jgi:hypothetical protein
LRITKRAFVIGCSAVLVAFATAAVLVVRDDGETTVQPAPATPRPQSGGDGLQAAVRSALARDIACADAECQAPSALATRAARLASVVRRLDAAYARDATQSSKVRRVPTSSFLHAALELQSCFQLSAQQHGGAVEMAECRAPLAQYYERRRDLQAAVGPRT